MIRVIAFIFSASFLLACGIFWCCSIVFDISIKEKKLQREIYSLKYMIENPVGTVYIGKLVQSNITKNWVLKVGEQVLYLGFNDKDKGIRELAEKLKGKKVRIKARGSLKIGEHVFLLVVSLEEVK